jgi:signal transduction histidine kinase
MRSYLSLPAKDKDRIVQVLSNLLSNYIEFAKKDGGKIFVTLEKKSDFFQLITILGVLANKILLR